MNSTDFYIEYFKILSSINPDENEKKTKKSKRNKKKSHEFNSNMYIDTDENLFDTPRSERKPHPSPKKIEEPRFVSAPVSTKNSNKIENVLNQKIINNEFIHVKQMPI